MKLKNAPVDKEEVGRRKWPFREMRVGGPCLDTDDREEFLIASKRAHDFAFRQKPRWKFTTRWLKKKSIGRIRRVE